MGENYRSQFLGCEMRMEVDDVHCMRLGGQDGSRWLRGVAWRGVSRCEQRIYAVDANAP